MKRIALVAAILAGIGSSAMASGPIRLTEAQMDQVVAGAIFQDTVTTTSVSVASYHGYSNNLAAGPGPGTSERETTTVTTTTRTLDCPGNSIESCYAPGQPNGLNPNTVVTNTSTSSSTSVRYLSGPGNSPYWHRN